MIIASTSNTIIMEETNFLLFLLLKLNMIFLLKFTFLERNYI